MQQHEDVTHLSSPNISDRGPIVRSFARGPCLIAGLILLAVILACSFVRPNPRSASEVSLNTRLPTLTPTTVSTSVALALATETVEPAPTIPLANPARPESNAAIAFGPVAPGAEPLLPGPTVASQPTGSSPAQTPSSTAVLVADRSVTAVDLAVPSSGEATPDTQASHVANSPTDPLTATPTRLPTVTPGARPETAQFFQVNKPGQFQEGVFITRQPTVTPTSTVTPTVPATEIPTPTGTPTETPSPTPLPDGWIFMGVRVSADQGDDSLRLHGDVINNTGTPQEMAYINGTFYDAQGQAIPDAVTADYWPIQTIPQGGRVPFELTVLDVQNVGNFDLTVEAWPGDEAPSQEFEFLDLNQSTGAANYCVSGKLRNPGGELQAYLVTGLILFDSQDNVVNFTDDYKDPPPNIVGDQTMEFNLCVDSLGQEISRYELRAWGL